MNKSLQNRYAEFLKASGVQVGEVDSISWFKYGGFLRPAYLPHETPEISSESARSARRQLGGMFARWDSEFGVSSNTEWWYVIRRGPYSIGQVSGNTRSKIRRGAKRLTARPATTEEMRQQGLKVCERAVARFENDNFMPKREDFMDKLDAAENYPDVCEFFAVFRGDTMVGFSENHIHGNAVFWESIWYDPEAMGHYSSYLLTHAMLEFYLNDRELSYVSDGSRALYHDTDVQGFFIGKFGFNKEFARLEVDYFPIVRVLVSLLFPFRKILEDVGSKLRFDALARVNGLIRQEAIARASRVQIK